MVLAILTPEEESAEEMGFEVETGLDLRPRAEPDALAMREHEISMEEPQRVEDEAGDARWWSGC